MSIENCGLKFRGQFILEVVRNGKTIHKEVLPNGVVDVGIDDVLSSAFQDAASKRTGWALGLIDNAGFTALAATDTMSSHAGWTEFTSYSEANRVAWNPDAASSKSINNSTARDFTMSGSGTLYGAFLCSDNVKGGTTGILWATAAFSSTIPVSASDLIKLTYTVTGAAA